MPSVDPIEDGRRPLTDAEVAYRATIDRTSTAEQRDRRLSVLATIFEDESQSYVGEGRMPESILVFQAALAVRRKVARGGAPAPVVEFLTALGKAAQMDAMFKGGDQARAWRELDEEIAIAGRVWKTDPLRAGDFLAGHLVSAAQLWIFAPDPDPIVCALADEALVVAVDAQIRQQAGTLAAEACTAK